MKKTRQIRTVLLLALVSGILVLGISFIFISCGSDPQLKALDANKCTGAIDFGSAPDPAGAVIVNKTLPAIAQTEFTIEAWVKSKVDTGLTGNIFSRGNQDMFIALYVKDNEPRFFITPATGGYITPVAYNFTPTKDQWVHLAVALTKEDQSGESAEGCASYGVEKPHLALYVNGELNKCATTDSRYASNDSPDGDGYYYAFIGMVPKGCSACANPNNASSNNMTDDMIFDGVIDEVRFWTVARTKAEINQCMNQQLEGSSGPCAIDRTKLKGYWRFNECVGAFANDSSGGGYTGTIMSPFGEGNEWAGGWVEGKL